MRVSRESIDQLSFLIRRRRKFSVFIYSLSLSPSPPPSLSLRIEKAPTFLLPEPSSEKTHDTPPLSLSVLRFCVLCRLPAHLGPRVPAAAPPSRGEKMQGEEVTVRNRAAAGGGGDGGGDDQARAMDIYPLSSYYFGSKDALALREETLADRVQRMKSHYAAHGLRTCVEAVIVVELFRHPHLLLLQVRNSTFQLPGGRLRPGESGNLVILHDTTGKMKLRRDNAFQRENVIIHAYLFRCRRAETQADQQAFCQWSWR
ncbi:hypothetical protein EUGRSUZ_C03406 [Eucalyptus grandis]|uniref:Uncharacterized protein n=2 Tax=Eucalyptus grandis TaxID=71139 RepID=A0ACC3LIH0_EUCGR|nr:hypothetical protein EUGRSUZ_C03406 [Eucalyptus grandis]